MSVTNAVNAGHAKNQAGNDIDDDQSLEGRVLKNKYFLIKLILKPPIWAPVLLISLERIYLFNWKLPRQSLLLRNVHKQTELTGGRESI